MASFSVAMSEELRAAITALAHRRRISEADAIRYLEAVLTRIQAACSSRSA